MSRGYKVVLCAANITSIILCIAGYLLNMGWYRFLFGIIIIPILVIHYVIHGSLMRGRAHIRQETVLYSCLSNAAIALAFILFPDVSDAPGTYAAFGLYKNPPDFFWTIAQCSLIGSFVLTFITKRTETKGS